MALTINTNIKNDADGYLLDASGVKVEDGLMLPDAINAIEQAILGNAEKIGDISALQQYGDSVEQILQFIVAHLDLGKSAIIGKAELGKAVIGQN